MSAERHDAAAAGRLNHYWNDLTLGRTDATPADRDLDPALREAVDRLFRLGQQPSPDPSFVARLEESLMTATATFPVAPARSARWMRGSLHGRNLARNSTAAPSATWSPPTRRARWASTLAMAAVILLMLSAGYVGIVRGPSERGAPGGNIAAVPAVQQATPLAPATSCGTTSGASVPASSPVAVNVTMASPEAGSPNPVAFVWATDGAPESPELVSHVAIDPQCRLWVMDQLANRFLIVDLDGTLLETWGTAGSGGGQFDFGNQDFYHYNGIAFAPDGGFYVSDAGNGRIQRFDADRQFVRAWATHGGADATSDLPGWIAVGPDGNVYVSVGAVNGIVQVFSPDGDFLRAFGSNAVGPGNLLRYGPIAFDPAGNLWVADPLANELVQFSPTGEPLGRLEPAEMGTFSVGLAIDAAGRFYVTDLDTNVVSVFAPNGAFLYSWGGLGLSEGKFLDPFAIALDGAGGVYVTEGGSPRIQKFLIQS